MGQYLITSNGHYDKFIEKLDGNGNFLWANSFGGPQADAGGQIAADANNDIFLCGSLNGTTVLDKFNSNGNTIWSKQLFATTGPSIVDINIDNMGNLLSTGTFSGTYDFDPGPGVFNLTGPDIQDFFIWKLDNAGNFIWAKRVIGGGTNASSSIATDGSGNVYTTGFYSGTGNHDLDPGPGTYNFSGSGMFIQKLNASGNFAWAVSIAGSGTAMAFGRSIRVNVNGDVYTAINFNGTVDFNPSQAKFTLNAANGPFVVHKMTQTGGGAFALPVEIPFETLSPQDNVVYPNPNTGSFYIDVPAIGENATLTIYDMTGRIVQQRIFNGNIEKRMRIDLDVKSKGVHIVEVKGKERSFNYKVTIL